AGRTRSTERESRRTRDARIAPARQGRLCALRFCLSQLRGRRRFPRRRARGHQARNQGAHTARARIMKLTFEFALTEAELNSASARARQRLLVKARSGRAHWPWLAATVLL